MNEFMNALYTRGVGKTVTGYYFDQPFEGVISEVRPAAGDDLKVYIDLESTIMIHDIPRKRIVLSGKDLFEGNGKLAKNLHVYF